MSLSWLNKHIRLPLLGCRDLCKHHRICHFIMWSHFPFSLSNKKNKLDSAACVFNPQNFREIGTFLYILLQSFRVINYFPSCCLYLAAFWLQCSTPLIRAWYFSTGLLLAVYLTFLRQLSSRVIEKLVFWGKNQFVIKPQLEVKSPLWIQCYIFIPWPFTSRWRPRKFPLVFPPFHSPQKGKKS